MTGRCSRRIALSAFAALLCAAIALPAAAQSSLTIPDFRRPQPTISPISPGACSNCGRILSIREVTVERTPYVPAPLQGDGVGHAPGMRERNLVGAVLVLPIGQGSEAFVGGVGTPEMNQRFQDTEFEIMVRLDDGSLHQVRRPDGPRYRVGDRVRLQGIQLELVAG